MACFDFQRILLCECQTKSLSNQCVRFIIFLAFLALLPFFSTFCSAHSTSMLRHIVSQTLTSIVQTTLSIPYSPPPNRFSYHFDNKHPPETLVEAFIHITWN